MTVTRQIKKPSSKKFGKLNKQLKDKVAELEIYSSVLIQSLLEKGGQIDQLEDQLRFYETAYNHIAASFQISISGTLLRQ